MATLRRESDGSSWLLPTRCTVGRSPTALLHLDDGRVSLHHAEIAFEDGAWVVRDRDSRNGTRLDGQRLPVEQPAPLRVGARLVFGRRVAFVVEDLAAPVAMAADVDTGHLTAEVDGVLCLPDDQRPQASVFLARGGYHAEVEGEGRPVADGRLIELGPRAWRLCLPPPDAYPLEKIALSVSCSSVEEFVAATVATPAGAVDLPPRPHHGLLLALVRRRLGDTHLAATEQGWLSEDWEEAELLALRRELCGLGIRSGGALVERRRRQIRLAVPPERLAIR